MKLPPIRSLAELSVLICRSISLFLRGGFLCFHSSTMELDWVNNFEATVVLCEIKFLKQLILCFVRQGSQVNLSKTNVH